MNSREESEMANPPFYGFDWVSPAAEYPVVEADRAPGHRKLSIRGDFLDFLSIPKEIISIFFNSKNGNTRI
jgi:hypothetical protein